MKIKGRLQDMAYYAWNGGGVCGTHWIRCRMGPSLLRCPLFWEKKNGSRKSGHYESMRHDPGAEMALYNKKINTKIKMETLRNIFGSEGS